MAFTEVILCNMALSHVHVSREIADGGDGSLENSPDAGMTLEHQICSLWYPRSRDRLLSAYPWPFARAFKRLELADDGDGEVWDDEWENAYVYPADCLRIRRFVNDVGTGYFPSNYTDSPDYGRVGDRLWAWRYVIRHHGGTKVILTDVAEDDADLEYTRQVTDPGEYDEAFGDALALLVAHRICPALTADSANLQRMLAQQFTVALLEAKGLSINEENDRDDGDQEIVRSRSGMI